MREKKLTHQHFRLGVFAFDAAHVVASCECAVYICHEMQIYQIHAAGACSVIQTLFSKTFMSGCKFSE